LRQVAGKTATDPVKYPAKPANYNGKSIILTLASEGPIQHIVAARYSGSVREAAALPGRFLPELGRFGNPEAAIFLCAGLSAP
jgi:hypothetical protein